MKRALNQYTRVCRRFPRRHTSASTLKYSHSWSEHLQHLDAVLVALAKEKLYSKLSKCELGLEVAFPWAHFNRIDDQPGCGEAANLEAVHTWPRRQKFSEVRRFLGFTNYFRRFIQNYSQISRLLEELTGRYAKFVWTDYQEEALAKLKQALITAPVLRLPNVHKPLRALTDAIDHAIGGVLLQRDDGQDWHPIAFTSQRLRPEERNYHAAERIGKL